MGRKLTQAQHAAANAANPGSTLEYCDACGEPAGKAGAGDGSLYLDNGDGPYCDDHFEALEMDREAQRALDLHNASYDEWQGLSDAERDARVRSAKRH